MADLRDIIQDIRSGKKKNVDENTGDTLTMGPVEAAYISGTEPVAKGSALFKYIGTFREADTPFNKNYFDIITERYGLKLVWRIYHSFPYDFVMKKPVWNWDKISLLESSYNVKGKYSIRFFDCLSNCKTEKGGFVSDTLPFERDLKKTTKNGVFCYPDKSISIIFTVDYDNERTVLEEANIMHPVLDFSDFLENSKLADITFILGDEKIPAHQVVLSSQSKVFSKLCGSDKLNNKMTLFEIGGVETKIFKLLLRFIYTGKLECTDVDDLLKLMVIAHNYLVSGLVNICQNILSKNLCIDNAAEILTLSDLAKADVLKKKCVAFIIKNKNEVIKTNGYKEIIKSRRVDLLADIFNSM